MKVENCELNAVMRLITPDIFRDFRGQYCQTFDDDEYYDSGICIDFVQDDISVSKRGVLRGLHGDPSTWKLVSCMHGRFFLAVVDVRDCKTFGKWQGFYLDDVKRQQVLIPPGFANGHYVLSDWTTFHYKQSTHYKDTAHTQFTYRYDDPLFGIEWPLVGEPILSERDSG